MFHCTQRTWASSTPLSGIWAILVPVLNHLLSFPTHWAGLINLLWNYTKFLKLFLHCKLPAQKKNKKKRSRGGWWTLLNFTVWVLPKKWWINTQCVPNCTKRLIDSCFESLEKKGHISKLRLKRVGEIFSALLSNSCFPVKLEAGRTQNLWNLLQLEIASSFPL